MKILLSFHPHIVFNTKIKIKKKKKLARGYFTFVLMFLKCVVPGSGLGRIQGVPSGWMASVREDTWDQPWRGQVCVLLFDNSFYTLTQNVSKVQDAYSCLHRISNTSVCFLERAGCFLLSNSMVNLSTLSSGLGAH